MAHHKMYCYYELNDLVICLGCTGNMIKTFLSNYFLHLIDITFDVGSNSMEIHRCHAEPWRVTLVDTRADTMTGGRLLQVRDYLGDQPFCLTYGDGVADIDIGKLRASHAKHDRLATVAAVTPPGRFGWRELSSDGAVQGFRKKPHGDGGWINCGFFVVTAHLGSLPRPSATRSVR